MTFKSKKEIIYRLRLEISSRPNQALNALETFYSFQTEYETLTGYTSECNDYGFNSADSEILSSFTQQYQKNTQTISQADADTDEEDRQHVRYSAMHVPKEYIRKLPDTSGLSAHNKVEAR